MNEQEAIDWIKSLRDSEEMQEFYYADDFVEALDMAIKALDEVNLYKQGCLCLIPTDVYSKQCKQLDEYKELGTVEELREARETIQAMKERNITSEIIMEYAKFEDECVQKGFTFKSLLEAREKQIPKKPLLRLCGDCQKGCINCDRYEDKCPTCNGSLYIECGKSYKYCPSCGQRLDWSE